MHIYIFYYMAFTMIVLLVVQFFLLCADCRLSISVYNVRGYVYNVQQQ